MTYEEKRQMRENGATFQQIADAAGVSKQAVCDMLTRRGAEYAPRSNIFRIAYPGIRAWMIAEELTVTKLLKKMGMPFRASLHTSLTTFLEGKTFRKDFVDGILRVSGMTYEEAFAVCEVGWVAHKRQKAEDETGHGGGAKRRQRRTDAVEPA